MTSQTKPFEFEAKLKELEEITLWFEGPNVDLDQGIAKFERGLEIAQALKNHLETVDNKVEKIKQRFNEPLRASSAESADEPEPVEPEFDQIDQTDLFN